MEHIYQKILTLTLEDRLAIYERLEQHLTDIRDAMQSDLELITESVGNDDE